MTLINLDLVISAITSVANPLIKEKILRSETVIKLLQQFKLDPEHPPADFSGVYAYALVEYGVGKPKAFLELFRHETIKLAFRKALDHNNPSIVLSEVDAFLNTYSLGDEIRSLGLDVRREVAAFATVFIEVAKRTRTPADVLLNQRIGSLHQRIASITEQLDRLPTLEGIRTEIARLATDNQPALPATITENKCRAIALAQQMRGWFETLGYRFEKYEIWDENYFEWIINVPTRRNRYDRILVRGIEGEIGLKDIGALRSSVEQQKTDEGWLVTARRISRAARDEVEKDENRHLGCYTLDELIDQDADFSDYVDWLEAEISRRKIDTKYVPLACTKEEIDPDTKQRIGISRYDERDGWIDGYIDIWLDDPAKEHISVLGEFGTGKTWFAFHYAWLALQRYRDAQRRGVERPRLPLVITLRDFAKAINVENVLAGFFFTQHNIRLNSEVFEQLNRMGKLLLIFDGFDEMAAKVDRQQMINNFWELAKVVIPSAKVILTCRTEHFPEAKEGRALLNAQLQASTKLLTGETPQFEVLELEKFNDKQIRQVISQQAQANTVEQVMSNPQLLDLARRPVMTELILEALPDIEAGKPVDMSRVYLYAVRRKMERDIKSDRTFTSLADKLYFLCELSWEMLSNDQMSLNYRLFPDRIRRLFGSIVQEEKDLDHWHYDMMAQTMLVRNAYGDYTPAHRSLLEFFVAYKFAAELGILANDFTELAKAQSCLDSGAAPIDYTWSGYFSRQLDETGRSVAIAPLKAFTSESLNKLSQTFGKVPLTKAVMDLLVPMLTNSESVINVIEATRSKTEDEVAYVGGNAVTLLLKIDREALQGKNLNRTLIKSGDFSDANLRNVNFTQANLTSSIFTKILGSVLTVAFSPDDKVLATGDTNGEIHLWRVEDSERILTFKGHINWVRSIAFNHNGHILISGSDDKTIKLWDVQSGQVIKTLQGHSQNIKSVSFSPNERILASGSGDKTIRLWNVDTAQCFLILKKHNHSVQSVAFNPDSSLVASASTDEAICLWDIQTGQCLQILQKQAAKVRSVVFRHDGQILASGGDDQTVRLWDIRTGQCLQTMSEHTAEVTAVKFSPDGQMLASASYDNTVKLWDVNTGRCLNNLQGHTDWVRSITFSNNGKILASGADDQTARLWDVQTGQCLKILQGYHHLILSVAFSPDGQTLASGSDDGILRLWNVSTGRCFKTLQAHTKWLSCITFSSNGQILVSASNDKTLKLWDVNTGKCLKVFKGRGTWILPVALSPDDQILASGNGKVVHLWNVSTGQCLRTLEGHTSEVKSITFTPNGQTLVTGSQDNTVKLWSIETGCCVKTLQENDEVWSVNVHPQARIIANGLTDGTVKLWDVSAAVCLKTLPAHTLRVRSIAFSPDGQILASSSQDRTIKLWDVTTSQCLRVLQGHINWVVSISFSPNGQFIASGSEDGTIKLWNVKTGNCLKTLIPERPYENMNITGVKGLTEVEIASLKALGAIDNAE